MRFPFEKREVAFLAGLLFFAFVVRILFFSNPGYENDLRIYEYWFNTAATYGPRLFYTLVSFVDYPPLNVYIFWVFGSVAENFGLFGSSLMRYIIKLPPNIFDLATSALIFIFVRKHFNLRWALIATALYAFNPAMIFDAALWGQFDPIYTFFLTISLLLILESKPELAAATFMLGILSKPQSIALAPLLIFLIFRKHNWRRLLTSVAAAAVTVFAVIFPLEWTGGNPVTFLSNIYFGAYGNYAYTTVNAFNIWSFGGIWKTDTTAFLFLNLSTIGWIMFGALAAFTLYFVYRRLDISEEVVVLFSAFLLFFGFFMLPTRIHERYLFPAFSVMAMLIPFVKKMRRVYAVLTGTYFVNLAYVLLFLNSGRFIPDGEPVVIAVALINLVVLEYVLMLAWRAIKSSNWLRSGSTRNNPQTTLKKKRNL
jgi:dolichyl-phosphate-mannose-protein mannosyltransferase